MTQADTIAEFNLPATLDADAASALIAALNKLPRSRGIRLNAAEVASISPGYLQILISAFKTFPHLRVADASTEFVDAFVEYGVDYPAAEAGETQSAQVSELETPPAGEASPPAENASATPVEDEAAAPPAQDVSAASVLEISAPPPAEQSESNPPVAEPNQSSAPAAAEPDHAEGDGAAAKTILTIDDSRTMRDMLKMALGGAGFTVIQAVDGQDGLNALAQQPVDLIITDINMPKLDGFGVIRAVRNDPAYNNTPILVLSTEGEQESKDIAKDAGATGWIVKPFDPAGLVKIINTVCGPQ
jgi:two-component system, chemotaxis family, chemotaxis protein CheY